MKKKILAIVLCVAMLAIAIVGGTMAYFTDTDAATNTFTSGNVAIDLTEAIVQKVEDKTAENYGDLVAVDKDGQRNDVGDAGSNLYDYGKLYPGQNIFKDPTIENIGSEDAYIAAKIIVTDGEGDIHKLIGSGYMGLLRIDKMVSGGIVKENDTQKSDYNNLSANGLPVYGDETYSVYQVGDIANGVYTFYVFFEKPQAQGDKVVLFENILIDAGWDNEQMAELKDLKIEIQAYATQEYGFKDCFTAMTTAFPDAFKFN